nr:hypothetical protein [uncultured Brevundimonas sp.]
MNLRDSDSYKSFERGLLVLLVCVTAAFVVLAAISFAPAYPQAMGSTSDLFGTAGLLAALAGFVQLDVAGLFKRLLDEYSDDIAYPFGPTSKVTREIIDNPDRPVRTTLRNHLFFRPRTGFWLIVSGTGLQIVSLWT